MKSFIALLPLVAASPVIVKRDEFCGQWDSEVSGTYTVYNNLWGESAATSGSQCTTDDGLASDGSLSWSTSWTWAGGSSSVKSFANVVVDSDTGALSTLSSIPSEWAWTYTGSDIVADVAYDMFTSSTASGTSEYEVMIWLAALGGAGPISATGSSIATVTLAGSSWNLYEGLNGAMTVFSFVAADTVSEFCGDIIDFFDYLIDNQGLPDSQIIQTVGAGTEPFTGSDAVFTTSRYTVEVNF